MHRIIFSLSLLCLIAFPAHAQYTTTINSNRPGHSQGAFSVGRGVYQFEIGGRFGHTEHELLGSETDLMGIDYMVRVGFSVPQLEINLSGSFLQSVKTIPYGASTQEFTTRNFQYNTIGLKYLVFDPYKYDEEWNVLSWDENFEFEWKDLIPAVSVYAGANLFFKSSNPYKRPETPELTPKFAIITQHNFLRWAFVMNFIADKVTTDYPTYSGIFTLTRSFGNRYAAFLEYQAIKNDFYSDDLFRLGGAYLISRNFQVDVSGLINFKNTPSRWQVAFGASYRLDFHQNDDYIKPRDEGKKEDDLPGMRIR